MISTKGGTGNMHGSIMLRVPSLYFLLTFIFLYACTKARVRKLGFNHVYLLTEFTSMTWQADHKLSYALKHCNPHSAANIRSVTGVIAPYILHHYDIYSWVSLADPYEMST